MVLRHNVPQANTENGIKGSGARTGRGAALQICAPGPRIPRRPAVGGPSRRQVRSPSTPAPTLRRSAEQATTLEQPRGTLDSNTLQS
jgi:hypothetical protein